MVFVIASAGAVRKWQNMESQITELGEKRAV